MQSSVSVLKGAKRWLASIPRQALRKFAPKTRWGDQAFMLYEFLVAHRRWPTQQFLLNDWVYATLTSDPVLDPLRVFVTDKEFVKLYITALVGSQYAVPTLAVVRTQEDLDQFDFPVDCCVKPTHASGVVVIRRNGEPVSLEQLRGWFTWNYYLQRREANYKTLVPKIIVEPLLFGSEEIADYKVFCWRGRPKLVQVDQNRRSRHVRDLFDLRWNRLPHTSAYPPSERGVERPANLDEMLDVAARLASAFDFIRVDFYSNGSECFVGELTNFPGAGVDRFPSVAAERMVSAKIFDDASEA